VSALCVVVLCGVVVSVSAQPNGFLMAMVPKDGVSNHIFPYSINPTTGAATVLGDGDYIMASLQNTQNGGTYNSALQKVQFIGQSLTAEQNPTPNPTMNFLVSIDGNGDYTSSRMISYGGLVYTARAEDGGAARVFGMEQNTATTDARIDIIEDTGVCNNYLNTTATAGYLVGYAAVNTAASLFYVAVKNNAGGTSLVTASTSGKGALVSTVALSNPTSTRVTLCWDSTTHTLVSLERASGSSDSQLLRLDPQTGHTTAIVTLPGKATQGDCRSGFFFASGTSSSGSAWLSVVDIAAGKIVRNTPKLSVPAPTLLVFFPQ